MNIIECETGDAKTIVDGLVKFNAEKVPFSQIDPFINLNYKIEESGEIIAGILGCLYCWVCSGQVQPDTFLEEFSNSIGD